MPSKIEWTDETWNPITGCTPVSEGCRNCYAERFAKKFAGKGGYPQDNPFAVVEHPDKFDKPYRWKKPKTVFVCSMGDLFHPEIPTERILQIYAIIKECKQHRFLVLTKRSTRMKCIFDLDDPPIKDIPENLWLGVSIENQQTADERLPDLMHTACLHKFVSIEPILAPIVIERGMFDKELHSLEWVIVGDESGANRRPAQLDWVRSIHDQCVKADVPFFFKQWHDDKGNKISLPKLDGKVWNQMPRQRSHKTH